MKKNAVYIPSFDAKDVYLASQYENETRRRQGVTLKKRDGTYNLRRFVNAFDYSLDQIKLCELCELGFMCGRKEYTPRVINLTFKYKACEWNRVGKSIWLKAGICEKDAAFDNCVYIRDGELAGIVTDKELTGPPVDAGLLPSCFAYKNGKYTLAKNPKAIRQTSEIRADIYRDGFMCDGVHYVRWKRSSGSARVGKCLFIEEALYPEMHRWELCGLPVKEGGEIDLAALESYLSLPTSSIIDTLTLCPENILVIDDFESVFTDNVVAVSEENGQLKAERKTCEIKNSIWDGQGLISPDVMGIYSGKGMVLLRNRYFKCCCFNTNIQEWFADNSITDISQLNGQTRAKNISDIKLITTPSSIKYLKFGTLDQWLDNIDSTFGLVKYEKKTHFFDGRMVQTHYQLLNTLQMTPEEVCELLTPTFDYMTLIREDPAVLRYHIKYPINDEDDIQPAQSKNDIVYKMLGINNKFAKTKLYNDFRTDVLKSFTKNLKLGHVLVNGNYSTLLGNGLEMLQAAIGKFSGESEIGVGNIHSTRFEYGRRLLGSRSPHITCSNVWLPTNVADEQIDRYFNLTPEILYLNSIGENVLNRLSGCDFDSDSVLLTDNEILIKAALRNDGLFPIAMSDVKAKKTKRRYTDADKADLDVKTSNNLIGDIVMVSVYGDVHKNCGI